MLPSSPTVAARNGLWGFMATALTALEWPMISPIEFPLSAVMHRPYCSRPSPTAMTRCDSPSHAMSLRRPAMILYSFPAFSMFSGSQTLSVPDASPLAILKPLGANLATVVWAVWPVYSLHSVGLSMDRTNMDLPAYQWTTLVYMDIVTERNNLPRKLCVGPCCPSRAGLAGLWWRWVPQQRVDSE